MYLFYTSNLKQTLNEWSKASVIFQKLIVILPLILQFDLNTKYSI